MLQVGCAGALLSYLQRRRAAAYLPGDDAAYMMFRITMLEMFSLRETMFINADTLHSLGIIDAEAHPNSHNRARTPSLAQKKVFRYMDCSTILQEPRKGDSCSVSAFYVQASTSMLSTSVWTL